MTAGKDGIWRHYDFRGSSKIPECERFTLGGWLHHQGHVGTISYCVATVNGVNTLWTFNGQGRPRKCWEYTNKEWFLGLLHGDNSENTFALHGSYKNAQTIITSTTNLSDHKNNFFHKYGTKDETDHFCFDVLDNKIFATGCKSGIEIQSAQFKVADYALHTARIKNAVRMQKKRISEDVEQKEQEKIRLRWERNVKQNEGINVFDPHLSEKSFKRSDTLGAGTFGTAFKAVSKKPSDDESVQCFYRKFVTERELLIQQEMSHRNIVPMYAAFKTKISDFGIATDERDGTFCGSPGYIAPEVISRQKQRPLSLLE